MGSKNRFFSEIHQFLLEYADYTSVYVEPFAGGCNILDKIPLPNKIANDKHYYLIQMFKELQNNTLIVPKQVSEETYKEVCNIVRNNLKTDKYTDGLIGYIGFNLSYSGKWLGGYGRDKEGRRDYALEAFNNITKQINNFKFFKKVQFTNKDYSDIIIENKSIVYCDPPYMNTTKYKNSIDYDNFWDWVRLLTKNNYVYVSEYSAPNDFKCIWEKEINSSLTQDTGSKKNIERLFIKKIK